LQVETLVSQGLEQFKRIDILVNNAGVYGPFGAIEAVVWDEWVDAIRINLLGTVYACRALIPHFKRDRYGKIICLSGGGATNPLPRVSAYAASKAAVVRFAETLALEVREFGIDVNAIAPGALATRLTDQLIAAGPDSVGHDFHARMEKIRQSGGTPLELAAKLCVYLGSKESDGITGKLLSAVWDPWQELQRHRTDLSDSDIYTLRRIVPRDRGLSWGDK
jgi:3-oxoacyl-[acyl-carrier protein] reductase